MRVRIVLLCYKKCVPAAGRTFYNRVVLGEFVDVGTLQRAVVLDPANPELHHRLGMILSDSLAETDRAEGLRHLRRATALNPYTARYWSDLAWVCELADDLACATRGVKETVKLSPMTPQVH